VPAVFTRQKRGEIAQGREDDIWGDAPRVERFGTAAVQPCARNPADLAPITSHGLPETSQTRPGRPFPVRLKTGGRPQRGKASVSVDRAVRDEGRN